VSHPFDLENDAAFRAWRDERLGVYPASIDDLGVEVLDLASPTPAEIGAIRACLARFNAALVTSAPWRVDPGSVIAFGRALGLARTDANLFADEASVSAITPGGNSARGEYAPYTTRALNWHTDGYYNGPDRQVRTWTLFCRHQSSAGGTNGLLDHEVAYALLRSQDIDHVRALGHPRALSIPANRQGERVVRAESVGPVFSVIDSRLHMRYSARPRHAVWRDDPATQAARAALARLFSEAPSCMFRVRLEPGQGLVTHNVLHDRSSFEEDTQAGPARLLYRVRYLDRVVP
jgi:alpha-ketoglutarate-dependent taurine dioxygenase